MGKAPSKRRQRPRGPREAQCVLRRQGSPPLIRLRLRRRALLDQVVLLHEVQLWRLVYDYRIAIHRGLVVPQGCRILFASRLAWPAGVVDSPAVCAYWYAARRRILASWLNIISGSVSCGVWQMACRRVIKVGEKVAKDLLSASPRSHLHHVSLRFRKRCNTFSRIRKCISDCRKTVRGKGAKQENFVAPYCCITLDRL